MCRAPPNAVYGIETPETSGSLYLWSNRCAPPNAVYGIETLLYHWHTTGLQGCALPNAVYGIETKVGRC